MYIIRVYNLHMNKRTPSTKKRGRTDTPLLAVWGARAYTAYLAAVVVYVFSESK